MSDIYLIESGNDFYFNLNTIKDSSTAESIQIFNINDKNYGYQVNDTGPILKISENTDELKKLLGELKD